MSSNNWPSKPDDDDDEYPLARVVRKTPATIDLALALMREREGRLELMRSVHGNHTSAICTWLVHRHADEDGIDLETRAMSRRTGPDGTGEGESFWMRTSVRIHYRR